MIYREFFLDPWLEPEGSYELGSIILSFYLSFCAFSSFLGIGLLVFFLKPDMVLGVYIGMCVTETDFLEKSPLGKNDQKWSLNRVLWLVKSLILSGNGVKWKYLLYFNILQELHAWEKSGSQVTVKMLLANEISLYINFQYFINRLTVDFNFFNVDRHEWKE